MRPMKVIVTANQKGGVSKTSLTAHVAVEVERAQDGPAVLLDMDTQATLAGWWNDRTSDTPAFSGAPKKVSDLKTHLDALAEKGFRYCFIDTPPSDNPETQSVIAEADFVLIPIKPSPNDLRAVGATIDVVTKTGKPFAFVITQAKANTRLLVQAMAVLSGYGVVAPAIMHDRIEYAAAMTNGRTILETDPSGRGAAEIAGLWSFTKERMNESTKSLNNEITKPRKKAVA